MSNEPILVYPHNSVETRVTLLAASRLKEYMRSRGIRPIELGHQRARRPFLKRALRTLSDDSTGLLIYMGHGGPTDLNGSAFIESPFVNMVELGVNEDWLERDLLTCTIACDSLEPLGQTIADHGGRCFTGSTVDMFVNLLDLNHDGLSDIVDTFLHLTKSLVDGFSVSDAITRFKALSQDYLIHGTVAGKPPEYMEAMQMNMDYYGYRGDGSARWIAPPETEHLEREGG